MDSDLFNNYMIKIYKDLLLHKRKVKFPINVKCPKNVEMFKNSGQNLPYKFLWEHSLQFLYNTVHSILCRFYQYLNWKQLIFEHVEH